MYVRVFVHVYVHVDVDVNVNVAGSDDPCFNRIRNSGITNIGTASTGECGSLSTVQRGHVLLL